MTSAPEHELLAAARGDDGEAFGRLYRITPTPACGWGFRRPRRLLSADYGPAFTQTDDLGEAVGEPVWLEPFPPRGPLRAAPERRAGLRGRPPAPAGDPATGRFRLSAVNVLSVRGGRISELAGFIDPALHRFFDLPAER